MKLILERLPEGMELWQVYLQGSTYILDALRAWFCLNNIFVTKKDEYNRYEKIEYNYLYHFYRVSLFYNTKERQNAIEKIGPFLTSQGYRVEVRSSWMWIDHVQHHGFEFFIYV